MLTLPMCGLLAANWPMAPTMGQEMEVDPACMFFDLDVAGRASRTSPSSGIANSLDMSRLRFELGMAANENWSVRLSTTPIRSAPEAGYLGIAGESMVWDVQIAEVRLTVPELGLTVTGGFIDDPWMLSGNGAWGWRTTGQVLSQSSGWFDRADAGLSALWRAPRGWADAQVMLTAGEGNRLRERNNGKNLTAMGTVRPLTGAELGNALQISLLVRDGSKGVERARDHRLAARIWGHGRQWRYGTEVISARGVRGDPNRTPWGLSVWGDVDPLPPLTVYARYDHIDQVPGTADTSQQTIQGGVGLRNATPGLDNRIFVAAEHRRWQSGVAPVAGTAASETVVYLQLAARVRAGVPIQLGEPPPAPE